MPEHDDDLLAKQRRKRTTEQSEQSEQASSAPSAAQVEQWDGFPDDDAVLTRIWEQLRQRGVTADPVVKLGKPHAQ